MLSTMASVCRTACLAAGKASLPQSTWLPAHALLGTASAILPLLSHGWRLFGRGVVGAGHKLANDCPNSLAVQMITYQIQEPFLVLFNLLLWV